MHCLATADVTNVTNGVQIVGLYKTEKEPMKGSHMNSNLSSDRTWTMTSVFVCVFLDLCLTGEQQNLNKTESATLFAPVPLPLESVHFRLLIHEQIRLHCWSMIYGVSSDIWMKIE